MKNRNAGIASILLLFIILLVFMGVIAIGDLTYISNQQKQNVYPTATPPPGKTQTPITASGNFSKSKYSVNFTMNFLLEGGSVTGKFDGSCTGNISGVYDGIDGGTISGKAVGSCDPFFVPVPASATFTGIVNHTQKTVILNGSGSAAGLSGSGTVNLFFK